MQRRDVNLRMLARAAAPASTPWRRADFGVSCQYPIEGSGRYMRVCGKPSHGEPFCAACRPIVYRKPGAADAI